jgi:hypothetical protein
MCVTPRHNASALNKRLLRLVAVGVYHLQLQLRVLLGLGLGPDLVTASVTPAVKVSHILNAGFLAGHPQHAQIFSCCSVCTTVEPHTTPDPSAALWQRCC